MRARYWAVSATALLTLAVPPSFAQGTLTPPVATETVGDGEDIVVTGMGTRGYRLTADQLRDAVRAFQQNRAEYGPETQLSWEVIPASEVDGLELRLAMDDRRIPITIDSDGRFTLPADTILSGHWRLQSNAGQRQIRIRPIALSPNSTREDMRMGDARLMCRVYWAFANNEMGVFQRAMFGAIGGCGSSRAVIWYRSERPVATATVGDVPMRVRDDGGAYNPPLHDRAFDNEARLRITYR